MDKYYVIRTSEDGMRVSVHTKAKLEEMLNEEHWGEGVKFLTEKSEFEYESGIMIIKGECVTPKAIKHVEKWSV